MGRLTVMQKRTFSGLLLATALLATSPLFAGCETYEGVPYASIAGLQNGFLIDKDAPLVLDFTRKVDVSTVKVMVLRLETDEEGNLADEDADPETVLEPLFAFDGANPDATVGGAATFDAELQHLTIDPDLNFPLAEKLVVVLEPGLSDAEHEHEYIVREYLPFSYEVKLQCAPAPDFVSGAYYFLADVENPIAVQVQLLAWIDVDPGTGEFVGLFVNADRNKDPSRCEPAGLSCDDTEACRTLPEPACVPPSEKAASTDEYPDYLPNYEPPTGYVFEVKGCVDGSGSKIVFQNVPVDVVVESPKVSLTATVLTASFEKDDAGVLRGAGSIAVEHVFLGTIDSGKADGTVSGRLIPTDEIPEGLKKPDTKPGE